MATTAVLGTSAAAVATAATVTTVATTEATVGCAALAVGNIAVSVSDIIELMTSSLLASLAIKLKLLLGETMGTDNNQIKKVFPKNINTGNWSEGHIQGIAVDKAREVSMVDML